MSLVERHTQDTARTLDDVQRLLVLLLRRLGVENLTKPCWTCRGTGTVHVVGYVTGESGSFDCSVCLGEGRLSLDPDVWAERAP